MDPRYPPHYQVLMQTEQELPPDLLLGVLTHTFNLSRAEAGHLARPILSHHTVPYGVYSREIAEAKAFDLNKRMVEHGRRLNTSIMPLEG